MQYLLSEEEYKALKIEVDNLKKALAHLVHGCGGEIKIEFASASATVEQLTVLPLWIGANQRTVNGMWLITRDSESTRQDTSDSSGTGGA